MIAKRTRKKRENFSVLDIETNKQGGVLSIAIYDGKEIFDFLSWDEFLNFLSENCTEKKYQKIFAHNGGNFDWVSFIESQIKNLDSFEIVTSGSGVVFIVIKCFEKDIILADSILTLLKGLGSLCNLFMPEVEKLKDIEIDKIEEIFHNNKSLYYKYLHNDCLSLYQIMRQFMELLDIHFFPLTASSLALYIFRERYLDENHTLFKNKLVKSFEYNEQLVYVEKENKNWEEIDTFIARSYAGGRVECFRNGSYPKVNVYDINSLYPFVMSKAQIPVCTPIKVNDYQPGKCGFYEIEFIQANRTLPPVLWKRGYNGLEFVYEGTGIYSHIEIENLLDVGAKVRFIGGYVYPKTANVFKTYVDEIYKLRLQNKGTPLDYICKLLLNGLYGKFAETGNSEILEKIEDDGTLLERLKKGEMITPYDEEKRLYRVGQTRDVPHRLIHVASIITAMARTELYKYIREYVDTIVYCDTDSVHLAGAEMDFKYQGADLGQMKLEETGPGVYVGRKQYAVGKKVKFKGVTLKDKLSPEPVCQILTPADLEKINSGDEILFKFHTFPKMRSVLKGEKACKIKPIRKKLKKPEYQTNFLM